MVAVFIYYKKITKMKDVLITHKDITSKNLQKLLKERISGKAGFKVAVLLIVLKGELSIEEIANQLGVSRQFVYQTIWAVNENGLEDLKITKRRNRSNRE